MQKLEAAGLEMTMRADPTTTGPAPCVFTNLDGNKIMIVQHR